MTEPIHENYRALLLSMGVALVEIRAAKSLDEAKIIADIFHNCPSNIAAGYEIKKIESKMIEVAERHNYGRRLWSIFKFGIDIENRKNEQEK